MPDRCYKQVRIPIVIDIHKSSCHGDLVRQVHPRAVGDVLESALSHVSPKLISPELAREIEVQASISIHISSRKPIAVIVMRGLVLFSGIIDDPMHKPDPALLKP